MEYVLAVGSLVALMVLGLPVAFALGVTAVVMLVIHTGDVQSTTQLAIAAYKSVDSFVLLALPLYVLMGESFASGGISQRLFNGASAFTRHYRAGLGIATTLSCGLFAAISGSSMTNAVSLGRIAIPEMRARGYGKGLAAGLIASGGTLGMLIPPSLAFILYSALTDTSVKDLFAAGIVPGVIQVLVTLGYLWFVARVPPPLPALKWPERLRALGQAGTALFLPVFVLGGIYGGIFSAEEAAAVGAVYVLVINFFVYRSMNLREFWTMLLRTVETTIRLVGIVIGSSLLGHVLTVLQIPQKLTAGVVAMQVAPIVVLILIMLVLAILGMFLDAISITLITIPIIYPVITALGFDPVWFGVLLVMNLELAMITPPVAMNLFAVMSITDDLSTAEMWRGIWPYVGVSLVTLAIVMAFPALATWLPALAH